MKKLMILSLLITIIFSCKKNENRPDEGQAPDGIVQYKVNGNQVIINSVNYLNAEYAIFAKQFVTGDPRYLFNGQKGGTVFLGFAINTDSLRAQTYVLDSASFANTGAIVSNMYNTINSAVFYTGDKLTVNISSHANGLVSGTFTGKLSPIDGAGTYASRGTVLITEGSFSNIKCTY